LLINKTKNMQESPKEPVSTIYREPQASSPTSVPSFALHMPEASVRTWLPVSMNTIIRLVIVWLVLLIALNLAVTHFVGQPKLSQATPASAGMIRAKLSADDERRTNIDSLDIYLQKYYDKFGTYPSTNQINSIEFRKADPSFKVANPRTFMDPANKTAQLTLQPQAGAYFYTPTPAGCGGSNNPCRGYTIGATLDNGQLYTKRNIN
jgi:hypothetical protein